jgi:hypothetical protein
MRCAEPRSVRIRSAAHRRGTTTVACEFNRSIVVREGLVLAVLERSTPELLALVTDGVFRVGTCVAKFFNTELFSEKFDEYI